MAKRIKVPKRRGKSYSKDEFEFLVIQHQRAFEEALPNLAPQMHDFIPGTAWTHREALEVAHNFMQAALECYDDKPGDALVYYYLARGIGIGRGVAPEGSELPEPTFKYTPKKPS